MARAPVLYQETRISPTPTSSSSILYINTSASSGIGGTPSGSRKRLIDEVSGLDEESYARKRLASEGSVFFRPLSKSPRSFLWRVLNSRKLLEVQCVDLVQDKHKHKEGTLTFHIPFTVEILRGGVQCADAGEKDALELYVLTSGNELYTITLKKDLLVRDTLPTAFDPATSIKKFAPSSFSFRHPYRFVAVSALELFISLHDGGLMRLERNANENGSQWRETFFSEGGWSGTIKSWNPFGKSPTVRYGSYELEASAIASMAKSPNGDYVWTVSLDHTLKAWSTKTGKVVAQLDLLHENQDLDERKKQAPYVMSAESGTLVQILSPPASPKSRAVARTDDSKYYMVVHSPKDHQFKFYSVATTFSSIDGEDIELRDLQPAASLVPPIDELMNTNMWHLERFCILPGPQWQNCQLWVRARSGALKSTFMLAFDLLDDDGQPANNSQLWQSGWSVVDNDSLSTDKLRDTPEFSGLDGSSETAVTTSEKWLSFLFYPGRFSEVCLETALHVYRKGRGLPGTSSKTIGSEEIPLKERLTTAITAKIVLRRLPTEQPDYDRYQIDLQAQWNTFFSLVSHLHNRRHDSIDFVIDAETSLPWTICADFVAPIRMNSHSENLYLNSAMVSGDLSETVDSTVLGEVFQTDEDPTTCRIIAVARQFRHSVSAASREKFQSMALQIALDRTGESSTEETLQSLYETCGFGNEISDDDFDALNKMAQEFGGIGTLADEQFFMVAESLDDAPESRGVDQGQDLWRYGCKFSIAVVQETLQRTRATLLDLLALLVFMHGDLESDELDSNLRPLEVFESLIHRLMQTELRLWLASNVRQERQRSAQDDENQQQAEYITMTLYESMFIGDWDPRAEQRRSALPELLTSWSKRWTFYLELNQSWDDITGHVMGNLLRHKNIELATDFLRFLSDGPWHSYLRGRLYLATGEYALASVALQDAADEMAIINLTPFMVGGILSAEDVNNFGSGKAKYIQHVLSLYEKLKAFSYTADFANLALDSLEGDTELLNSITEIDERKRRNPDSPAGETVGYLMEEIKLLRLREVRDDILNRLFNALIQTSRFEKAFTALTSIGHPALQKACLNSLLQACVKHDDVPSLLALPLTGDLAQEADAVLLGLAKKAMTSTTPASTTSATPPYHQILFAFRTQQGDFRGAAAILYEHLERLRHTRRLAIQDPSDDSLVRAYALLVNTLACCGDERSAWLLADPILGVHGPERKRVLVRLDDVRRDYAAELDRRSEVALGRFPLVGPGEEVEMSGL